MSSFSTRCVLVFLGVLLCFGQAFSASERDRVYYAGFVFLGDYKLLDSNYPITRSLEHERGLSEFLRKELQRRPTQLDLRYELGNLDDGRATAIAVALERERVSREIHEFVNGTRITLKTDISLQVLTYDVEKGSLLDSFQVTGAVNHVVSGDERKMRNLAREHVRGLYFGSDVEPGLLAQAADRISKYKVRSQYGLRFQVRDASFLASTRATLPSNYSLHQLQQHLGQVLTGRLSEITGVAVIPYARGYAFGNQLPGRFANGSVFNILLPEPDYVFDLEIRSLSRTLDDDNLLFGTQLRFTLIEPFTNTTHINGDFQKGIWKYAINGRSQADWSAYEDAIEDLLKEISEQLKKPTRAWHEIHSRYPDQTFRQFSEKDLFSAHR